MGTGQSMSSKMIFKDLLEAVDDSKLPNSKKKMVVWVMTRAALHEPASRGDDEVADRLTPVSYTHLTLPTKRIV